MRPIGKTLRGSIFKKMSEILIPLRPHPKIVLVLGLQCQTPLRSYPLSLIRHTLLIPYPVPLPLDPYPQVVFLSWNLGEVYCDCDCCDCPKQK